MPVVLLQTRTQFHELCLPEWRQVVLPQRDSFLDYDRVSYDPLRLEEIVLRAISIYWSFICFWWCYIFKIFYLGQVKWIELPAASLFISHHLNVQSPTRIFFALNGIIQVVNGKICVTGWKHIVDKKKISSTHTIIFTHQLICSYCV